MKRFRLIGLTLMAVFALAAMLSASASAALPEFLTSSTTYTGTASSTSTLENSAGTKVECGTAKGSGGLIASSGGTFHINFEKCKSSGFGCNTETDSAELILSEGTFHDVSDTLGTGETLGVAILFEPKETTFTCAGGLVNNKVKGTVLCLVLTPLTSSLTHSFHCLKGTGTGTQAQTHYWNDSGTEVKTQLLSSLNGGEFKESNEQALSTIVTATTGAYMNE